MKHTTRWATLIAALALVAAACSSAVGAGSDADASGSPASGETPPATATKQQALDPAPATSFALFDGSTATFADYSGRPLVVNFWASWCPSCVAEMSAAFRPVQQQLGDQVAFLGLNMQDERDKAERLVDETGVLFDLGEDPAGDVYLELGGLGMPFTVFIDGDGNIVEKHNGPVTEGQLAEMIEELLLA